ncbi:hypothetical protein R5R35_004500 [Gryllus longicercus]|uniref:Pacifastin domain-containing protein n=1 Tax=Gryllus longicercus TaxID=2509291 RepID=A0AAN9Z985_9ORTH
MEATAASRLVMVVVLVMAGLVTAQPAVPRGSVPQTTAAPAHKGYPQGPCTPGHRTAYLCNSCYCTDSGSGYVCTKAACPQFPPFSDKCVPGTTWREDCNSCGCTASGTPFCTLKACGVKIAVGKTEK